MRISDWSSDVCSSDLKKGGDLRLEPDGVDRGSHLASQLQDILETLCGDQPGTRATTLDNSISGHSGAMNEALYTFSSYPPFLTQGLDCLQYRLAGIGPRCRNLGHM